MFEKTLDYALGFYAIWVVYLGRKMRLFETIANHNGISANDLAGQLGYSANVIQAWASAAACLGFLRSDKKGGLSFPRDARDILLEESSPYFLGGHFSYAAQRSFEFRGFDDLFVTGQHRSHSSANTIEAFEQATSWDHFAFLEILKLKEYSFMGRMLSTGCRMLDVGCGTGGFMEKLGEIYPESRYIGIDPYYDEIEDARMIRPNKSAAPQRDGQPTVVISKASAETMRFDNEFDLIYSGEVLYLVDDRMAALQNCFAALKPGGTIAIIEGLMPDSNTVPRLKDDRILVELQLDFMLQGHASVKKNELREIMVKAGFSKIHMRRLAAGFHLITAHKPM